MARRAVVFDLLGTLVDSFPALAYESLLRRIAEDLGTDQRTFVELWHERYEDRTLGLLGPLHSTLASLSAMLGVSPGDAALSAAVSARAEFLASHLAPRLGALGVLHALKKHGIPLGLISDCSHDIADAYRRSPLATYFDANAFSCELGHRKPDPFVYHWTTDALKVSPAEVIYVGDGGNNELTGAAAVGMLPLRLTIATAGARHVVGSDEYPAIQARSFDDLRVVLATELALSPLRRWQCVHPDDGEA